MLVAQGRTNREIAHRLTISERTAEKHTQNILLFGSACVVGLWATWV